MTTQQPEAVRLADECDEHMVDFADVAAELRRLHEVNEELLAALKEVYTTCDWHGDDGREAMMKASAAINKAERTTT